MTSAQNTAGRITAGLYDGCSLYLLTVAGEATAQGIAAASPKLLQAWAADVMAACDELQGEAGQYWRSVADALTSMAMEKATKAAN